MFQFTVLSLESVFRLGGEAFEITGQAVFRRGIGRYWCSRFASEPLIVGVARAGWRQSRAALAVGSLRIVLMVRGP